jgi:hypothetical protein
LPEIRITVDGKVALTVDMAASRYGLSPAGMRKTLGRLLGAGAIPEPAHLDARTPLYVATALEKAMAARPGRGVGGGRPKKAAS